MTIWSPQRIAQTWIYQTLSADPTIAGYVTGIHGATVEEGTEAPYIVMVNKSSSNLMEVGQDIVWITCVYNVDLVVLGDDIETPDPAFVRMEQLLHKSNGVVDGGKVLTCTQTGHETGASLEAGNLYTHLVQFYELLVQPN